MIFVISCPKERLYSTYCLLTICYKYWSYSVNFLINRLVFPFSLCLQRIARKLLQVPSYQVKFLLMNATTTPPRSWLILVTTLNISLLKRKTGMINLIQVYLPKLRCFIPLDSIDETKISDNETKEDDDNELVMIPHSRKTGLPITPSPSKTLSVLFQLHNAFILTAIILVGKSMLCLLLIRMRR
jgi:hypothetical protein